MLKKLKQILLILVVFSGFQSFIEAQESVEEVNPPDYIKTIQLFGSDEFSGTPILKLGEPLTIRFDDINGDEADYYYKITHYDFDWKPSVLYKNEYLNGFDDIRIINYENSFNSLQLYSHYTLRIPNEDTRSLKVSGNYMIEIYNDDDEIVFSRKFIVYENLANVKVYTKRSRDLKYINTRQVVQFEISSSNEILKNPKRTVKTLVIQNNDLKNAITDLIPQFTIANDLMYKYDIEASFWAGNEYLFFDNKEVRSPTANIRRIDLEDIYNNYLYTDIVRANRIYTYNPDINGNFVVRNLRASNSNTEADYVLMHFSLECYEPLDGGEIHIYGNFNNYIIDASTRLTYDKENAIYKAKRLFKQGFYNYKYVLVRPDGTLDPGFISGNFDETENEYVVIPYYRAPAARYDRAIGKGIGNSRNITN
ncbi:type IX secretion system plug protein [Aquimarina sp. M1]